MALLSQSIDQTSARSRAVTAQPLFVKLLETWEALNAAEAERAAEDAKLFKNKVKETAIQTEEVSDASHGVTNLRLLDLYV